MKKHKNALVIIDAQNDFCTPEGALFVPGAEKDMQRLVSFIENGDDLDQILFTMDNHQIFDISHPTFWKNVNGETPPPFTQVTLSDINQNKWRPETEEDRVKKYIHELESQGEYTHTIWPEHCIAGSWGAALTQPIEKAINKWAKNGKTFTPIYKGLNNMTEHFGALRANIPDTEDSSTLLNKTVIDSLAQFDTIYIAGEAKSHCVANTLKQFMEETDLIERFIILENCMSDVPGFENFAQPIFDEAIEKGAQSIKL